MKFCLLGRFEVSDVNGPLPLGGPKQRTVLAHLLLRPNQLVPADRLIDEVWGDEPPEAARNSLQTYISHLRKALGPERVEGRSRAYVLHAHPEEVDALRFESLVKEARTVIGTDPAAAARAYDDALALWRGPALDDLADQPSLQPEIARLEELRMATTEERIAAELALGRHAELVPELETLIARNSLRERLWAHLMVALYRSGRQGDALGAFQRAREILADELGIDPSPELQRLQEQVLRQDPVLDVTGEPLRGYRLLEQIGEGSFGVVHRAFQPQVGREVAVKVIHPRLANDPEFIRRFESEAQLVARLEHPHIVPLYDYWREPDGAYLVMRFLRGGSLRDALAAGSLEVETVIRVVKQLALALTAAHRQGVVHRDVKPANVLFDDEGNAYLSDFGIAKDPVAAGGSGPSATPTAFAYYVSPEEIRGEDPTPRTDIYSLGVLLYEMLAGRHPFADSPPEDVRERHLTDSIPSVVAVRPDLPATIDGVIERATAKDPDDRYAEASALTSALRSAFGSAPTPAIRTPALEARNPYKGLRPFHEPDAADFFGREEDIERLVVRMGETDVGSRLLAVVGPSGSGKSSLVRAGLIPALRRGALPGSEEWFVVEMLAGGHPFAELKAALLRIAVDPPPALDELERNEYRLLESTSSVLPGDDSELLLVIDQFEELFTLVEDEDRRADFLTSLAATVTDPRSRVRVVITLRADFYDRPLLYKDFGDLLAARTHALTPLSVEQLERAVLGPAEKAGVGVDPRLLGAIAADVADQPGALPLLQYALTELFERRSGATLTSEAYRDIGGVSGALARRAEALYAELNDAGREATRQLFLRLVTIGDEGMEDTRRRVLRAELTSLESGSKAMGEVIDVLGAHRLLSFDRDPLTRGPTVEVAHEAVLGAWARLRGWIESARDDLKMHRRIVAASTDWVRSNRDPSFLLRGGRLSQVEGWTATSGLMLAEAERAFLDASVAQREAERSKEEARRARESATERRSVRRLRALVAVFAVASLIAALLTVVTFNQRGRARRQALVATARELAAGALANLETDPERSILLAMEAVETYRRVGTPVGKDAAEALHSGVQASRIVSTLRDPSTANVAFSPDGDLIATGGTILGRGQNDVLLWDSETREQLHRLAGHTGDLNELVFSPDGSSLATAAADDLVILWEPETGEILHKLTGHTDQVEGLAFTSDGRRLVSSALDGTIRIWNARSGKAVKTLTDPDGQFYCGIAWSPDGSRLAVGTCFSGATVVAIWDVGSGRRSFVLEGSDQDVVGVSWSPDGRRVAAASLDGLARVWDARSGRLLLTLKGHTGGIYYAHYSPDGESIATASSDGTARVWEAETGAQRLVLAGHQGSVGDVAWRSDGERIVTGGADGTARVWDVTPEGSREELTLAAHPDTIFSVSAAFSPDGSLLLTAGSEEAALWDVATGSRLQSFSGDLGIVDDAEFNADGTMIVTSGAPPATWEASTGDQIATLQDKIELPWFPASIFSPDGKTVVSTHGAGTITLWDPETGQVMERLRHSEDTSSLGAITQAAFSPDGTMLATSSLDGTSKVWDLDSGRALLTLEGHQGHRVHGVAFSPDGRRLATSGSDGTTVIWEVPSGRQLTRLTGHTGVVFDVAFSPDGTLVATASDDNTARLWEADTGREILKLTGHEFTVYEVTFSPDGNRVVTAGLDGSARVYLLRLEELMDLAQKRVTRGFTDEECRQYLHVAQCSGVS